MFDTVWTKGFDNNRSNSYHGETRLTNQFVKQYGVRRLFNMPLIGDARGTEGQPLLRANVAMPDGQTHNILLTAGMSNIVHCFDADDGSLLWAQRIGVPINGSRAIDAYTINDHWGVLSTPVLSPDGEELYCVAWSSPDGSVDKAHFWFHGLNVNNGIQAFPPLSLDGVTYSPGHGLPSIKFASAARKQRCALALAQIQGRTVVFIAAGSVMESLASNRGWVIAVDVTGSPVVSAAWTSTAKGAGAGIWMAGQGPAIIGNKLYLMTGNGAFDAVTDFGECLLELTYDVQSSGMGTLRCTDWFSPFSDSGREGLDPARHALDVDEDNTNPSNMNGWNDQDLGSGGLVVIPELGYAIGAGKDGIAYVLKLGSFGKTQPTDLRASQIQKNYAKARWIGWFTYYNAELSPTPDHVQDLNALGYQRTRHQHSTPVVYKSPKYGWMVFCWGENSALRAWQVGSDGGLTYLARSAETASPQAPVPPGGMPGAMLTLSANGSNAGAVLWASVPYQDANKVIADGRLLAYDVDNFQRFPGSNDLQIMPLWDSQDWGIAFKHNKFNVPVVANGKVYLPSYDGQIVVLG